MDFIIYGTDFGHRRGEFCVKRTSDLFFISHFQTDYVYERDGELLCGNGGDLMIIPPGETVYHGPGPNMNEGFVNDWIYVGGDDFADLLSRYPLPLFTPIRCTKDRMLRRCIERINSEKSSALAGSGEKCDIYMTETVIELYRAYIGYASESGSALDKLRGEFMKNPRYSWSLASMADFCGYSQSRFSALYRQKFGISPVNDLISIRIERAKLLLEHGSLSVFEISDAVGFGSIYYFSRAFKEIVGISPTEYRICALSNVK